jgi:hypothetical protein
MVGGVIMMIRMVFDDLEVMKYRSLMTQVMHAYSESFEIHCSLFFSFLLQSTGVVTLSQESNQTDCQLQGLDLPVV